MRKRYLIIGLVAMWACVLTYVGYRIWDYYVPKEYDPVVISGEGAGQEEPIVVDAPEMENPFPDGYLSALADEEITENMIGWLEIPGLPAESANIIVQTTDNSFYLTHNNYDESDAWGSYFVGASNNLGDVLNLDRVTTIFGHSNGNATSPKFAYLKLLKDPEYAQEAREIILWVDGMKTTWQIFAAGDYPVSDVGNDYMLPNPPDDYFWSEVTLMKSVSYNQYDVGVSLDDRILVLSTCSGGGDFSTRFIVCAKLVRIEDYSGEFAQQ